MLAGDTIWTSSAVISAHFPHGWLLTKYCIGERVCWDVTMHISMTRYLYFRVHSVLSMMESQNAASSNSATTPAVSSCRRKKSEDATFLVDLRDHIDEFVHASMDEHKTCFKKTIQKMFGMSKIIAEKNSGAKEVESVLPLQTTVSD